MEEFLINLQLPALNKKIDKLEGLTLADVLYLQAESNYTVFYFQNGRKLMTAFSLGTYRTLETFQFVRANRSYLINANFIKKVDFDQNHLVLENGISVAISRRRKGSLMYLLQESKLIK